MITVRLYTGQVLTFPDGTSEEAIRRASQEVLSGEADRKRTSVAGGGNGASFDLSGLRGTPQPQPEPQPPSPVDDPRARTEARLRAALPPAIATDPRPPEERVERSPDWWRSVTGDPSGSDQSVEIARERQLRAAEESGVHGMEDLGFEDRGTYYFNPTTEERVLKRRRTGYSPEPLDPGYRPLTSREQRLKDVGAPYRQPDSSENLELGRAFVGGIPGRVAASEAGLLLPLQAAEAIGAGIKREVGDLASGQLPRQAGESFAAGARRGWTESPITQGAETINREVVEPDREWLARAAVAAGVSPGASAVLDTAQMVAGEALNPGNYIGLDMLRGVAAADRIGTAAARTAALEARGGARSISTGEGIVTREYGTGRAPSELAQARAARSGRYAPWGDEDPLIYRDETVNVGGIKGRLPDAAKRIVRESGLVDLLPIRPRYRLEDATAHRRHMGIGGGPIPEPSGPRPRPRDMVSREAIPTPIEGGTPESVAKITELWDYASRRHPRIARTVSRIVVEDWPTMAYVDLRDRSLHLGGGADLGVVMHELTHVGQRARMRLPDTVAPDDRLPFLDMPVLESTAIRRGEVYGQVPFKSRAGTGVRSGVSADTAAGSVDGIVQLDNGDISDRFANYLRSQGVDDPDLYHDLPKPRQAELDRGFAAMDEGPSTESWNQFLSNEGLESRDYFELPLPERAKLESRYRMWAAEQAEGPDIPEPVGLTGDEQANLAQRGHPEFAAPVNTLADRTLPSILDEYPGADPRLIADAHRRAVESELASGRWPRGLVGDDYPDIVARYGYTSPPNHQLPGGMLNPLPAEDMPPGVVYGGPRPASVRRVPGKQHLEQVPYDADDASGILPIDKASTPYHVRTNDEITAERMGWKSPTNGGVGGVGPRPTRVASSQAPDPALRGSIDPITTPEGQTNFAAQIDPVHGYFGDPDVAAEVIAKSDEVFRQNGEPQTWNTLEQMAANSGYTVDEMRNMKWDVLPPEVRLRMGMIFQGNKDELAGLHGKVADGTASDADKIRILRLIEEQGNIIRMGARSGSAYGRALNSAKMEVRRSLSPDQVVRQKLYREYANEIDANRDILDALARLDPNNPEELMAFQRLVDRPKFREYLQEYWIASVLSGPATHERNAIGNTVNAVMENAVVRPLSAGFDWARTAGTGAEREIFLRETPEAIIGLTRGIRQGARRGLEVLKRGYPTNTHGAPSGKLMPVRSAFARSQNRVVREVVGPIVTMPLRLLSASDELFKVMNHTAELYAQAAKAAKKAGLSGRALTDEIARLVQNPTDEMIEAADSFALKATFNDETSAVGKAIMNLRDLPRTNPETRIGQIGAETYRAGAGFVIPFVRIADRLMVRGFEYTPLGAIKSIAARQSGNLVESADLAARSAIGSVIMAYAASLAYEGRLTAGAPVDERERAAFYAAQKQPWSVRTEDGIWIPYGGLQPVGTPFALAAAAWKGWKEGDEAPNTERVGHAASMVGQYVTDQSFMEGLSKFMEAIEGGEGAGRAFSDLAAGTIGGFAPYSGLQRSVAQAIDPRVIDAKTIGDRIKRNIPGMSLDMRAKLTPWGEEVIPVGGRLRSVLAPGSILLPSQEQEDPLDAELARLDMPLGTVGKSMADKLKKRPAPGSGKAATDWLDRELNRLGMPLSYVDQKVSGMYGNGKSRGTWKLDDDEWHMYQQTAGRATRKVLERLFSRADYAGWDSDRQRDEVERAIGAAREYAKMWAVRYHRANRPRTMSEVD